MAKCRYRIVSWEIVGVIVGDMVEREKEFR